MSTDLLEHLRKLTAQAMAERQAEAQRRAAIERAEADAIIERIPVLAGQEARRGHSYAIVIDCVRYRDRPEFVDQGFSLDPEQLIGASRLVWEYCVEQCLSPKLAPRWVSLGTDVHRIDFALCIEW